MRAGATGFDRGFDTWSSHAHRGHHHPRVLLHSRIIHTRLQVGPHHLVGHAPAFHAHIPDIRHFNISLMPQTIVPGIP